MANRMDTAQSIALIDTEMICMTNPASQASGSIPTSRGIRGWLQNVPIADPVDRRNAPMMQIVLLMLGVLPSLAWLYRFLAPVPWRAGETLSLVLSMALSVLALFSVWLIRRGRFQWAVRQLMLVVATTLMLSYLGTGFDANRYEHPIQMIWLVIAGLMISRQALWLMYGWTMLAFSVGTVRDVQARVEAASSVMNIAGDAVISAIIFLFISVVIDRSVTALRESLSDATQRSADLASVNQRLLAEINERERVEAQLIHAQKVEAIGRLASGIAHDFNHLIGLASGYVAKGQRSTSDAEMATVLAGIDSALRRASAVSQKLLTFSRPQPSQARIIDVAQVVTDMKPLLRQLFDPSIRMDFRLPERPTRIHFDPAQLELVLLNIASNADHAMPEGGEFQLGVREDGSAIAITLRDTGHGMSDELRQRILEPFFTTKEDGQGTGLGLAVAHDLIAKGGGSIEVLSAPGEGATFVIRLPAAAGSAQPATQDVELEG